MPILDLSVQLSSMSIVREAECKDESISKVWKRLDDVQDRILRWRQHTSIIWLQPEEEVADFFGAVNEVCLLFQALNTSSFGEPSEHSMLRARAIVRTAMAMLEKEFRQVLTCSRQSFGPVSRMSFCSSEDSIVHYRENASASGYSSISSDRLTSAMTIWGDSISMSSEHNIDLIDLDAIPHLKSITKLMFIMNCKHELSQAYISVRKDFLDDCLYILGLEKLTTDDMSAMDWTTLDSKIKKHIRAVKLFVRGYLASEKGLCEKIFNEFGSLKSVCFFEASRISVLQLLNFPDSVAKVNMGPHNPVKLFRLLDMYGVLKDLLPDINALFSDDALCSVAREFVRVLIRLGDSIRVIFLELVETIASQTVTRPFAGGGVNPFTRYVVNHVKLLTDYKEILNLILQDNKEGDSIFLSSDVVGPAIEEEGNAMPSLTSSPMTLQCRSVFSTLKANLEDESNLYNDYSLKHFYLMNNIHYMFHNIKNSEVRLVLGDEWFQSNLNFEHHALMYVRAAWSPIHSLVNDIHSLFREEGPDFPGSIRHAKRAYQAFDATFEKIYETQRAWFIHDPQLRKELQILISLNVKQAYQTFLPRYSHIVDSKYIKYTSNDVENYILGMFAGKSEKLRNSKGR